MLDLRTLGYAYPIKAQIFGNDIRLMDAVGRIIFRPEPYTGGYAGRDKMQKVIEEIARMFNENDPAMANLVPTAWSGSESMAQSFTENDFVSKPASNGEVKRGRGRPRKI